MKNTTLFRAYDNCLSRQAVVVAKRSKGNFGVAVNDDPQALEWQRLDRIAGKCFDRIQARLTAADELAEIAEKAENALEVLLDTPSSLAAGTARAALRELTAVRCQYGEAK